VDSDDGVEESPKQAAGAPTIGAKCRETGDLSQPSHLVSTVQKVLQDSLCLS
jgi:hypothetical protein